MENQRLNFIEIVKDIEKGRILLPDFQREFVWREEERQRKIVASVLAKMPIGSILLLKSKPDEYASKYIGCKREVGVENVQKEVEFLLDGQQRMTVLTNVFSNVIHEKCEKVSDLLSPSLKRRFFLRIPKWSKCRDERDLFGVHDLEFCISDSKEPDFLTADILPFVECIGFFNHDKAPYNPQRELSTDLDEFCLSYEKGYLIPFYLLIASDNVTGPQMMLRNDAIVEAIANRIRDEIENHFMGIATDDGKSKFIDEIFSKEEQRRAIKSDYSLLHLCLEEKKRLWKIYFQNYISSCIRNVALNKIEVGEEQRARAIDIYENLNRGGVSLKTFDLIMARVAKVSKENFYKRLIANMQQDKIYDKLVLPECIVRIIGDKIECGNYNATIETGCYSEDKNEIAGKYIDAFLNVLSLYCYNTEFHPDEYKLENMKSSQILKLTPEQIHTNSEKVCEALDRAMFFFQSRCGIRNIQEMNYSLMIVLAAVIFLKKEWFDDKYVHDKLEAWYWAAIFSGEYDKDQNTKMISHLQSMVKTIQIPRTREKIGWILNLKNNVLECQNFSDESFLLMEKVEEDRYPKLALRGFLCQYLLARTYSDMFLPTRRMSVYSDEAGDYQAHHIVPLGTVKKVGESTVKLRRNAKHICNSPLNFVYITKKENREIADEALSSYIHKICDESKDGIYITAYDKTLTEDGDIKEILRVRYASLKSNIKERIVSLLC